MRRISFEGRFVADCAARRPDADPRGPTPRAFRRPLGPAAASTGLLWQQQPPPRTTKAPSSSSSLPAWAGLGHHSFHGCCWDSRQVAPATSEFPARLPRSRSPPSQELPAGRQVSVAVSVAAEARPGRTSPHLGARPAKQTDRIPSGRARQAVRSPPLEERGARRPGCGGGRRDGMRCSVVLFSDEYCTCPGLRPSRLALPPRKNCLPAGAAPPIPPGPPEGQSP